MVNYEAFLICKPLKKELLQPNGLLKEKISTKMLERFTYAGLDKPLLSEQAVLHIFNKFNSGEYLKKW